MLSGEPQASTCRTAGCATLPGDRLSRPIVNCIVYRQCAIRAVKRFIHVDDDENEVGVVAEAYVIGDSLWPEDPSDRFAGLTFRVEIAPDNTFRARGTWSSQTRLCGAARQAR
jgi:hypothetical protein